jgi:branched-chain amino acid transport system permease protein
LSLFAVTFPIYGSAYQLTQIGALSMVLGIIALSMVFLAGYGGLVSLAQLAIAGAAAYTIGIMTVNHSYPLWQAIPMALLVATIMAFVFGVVSVRTTGIYFLMITLALGEILYNVSLENYSIFTVTAASVERAPVVGGLSLTRSGIPALSTIWC